MAWNVDTHFVQQYHDLLVPLFQQKGSRLRDTVFNRPQHAEFDYFDRLGTATGHAITTRHGATPRDDIDHTRRRNSMTGYNNALLFDNQDRLRMIIDPTSKYAQSQAWALGRKMDEAIITAASGTAYTGKSGATTQAFDANNRIAVDYVESGAAVNSGLTIGKLRQARFLLEAAEVLDMDNQTPTCVVTAKQLQNLLRTTEVTSSDYNSVKALVSGQVDTFLGFRFVRTQLLTKSGNNRTCLAYVNSAIGLGVGEGLKVRMTEESTLNYSIQVYSEATFGATRIWEEGVVEILCDETA